MPILALARCRVAAAERYRPALRLSIRIPAGRRPAAGDRRAVRGARRAASATRCCSASPARARPSRWRMSSQRTAAPGDHPGAEQDAGGAALRRDEELLPGERGRVFRLLLRLLPARGLCPAHRHLCREGIVAQRADRPDAPFGDARDPRAARRRRRRLGLLHLRHRLGRDLFADDRVARQGRPDQPHPAAARASSSCNTGATTTISAAARSACAATRSSCFRRITRTAPGGISLFGDEIEAIHEIDPLTGEKTAALQLDQDLRQQPLRDAAADPAAGDRADQARPQDPPRRASTPRASCWRRSGSSSARPTTSR